MELAVPVCLLPLLPVDLSRPWNTRVVASDASTSFGFGVAACDCSEDDVQAVGRLAERRGDYMRFDFEEPLGAKKRLGRPFIWRLGGKRFATVICKKATWSAPPGLL